MNYSKIAVGITAVGKQLLTNSSALQSLLFEYLISITNEYQIIALLNTMGQYAKMIDSKMKLTKIWIPSSFAIHLIPCISSP